MDAYRELGALARQPASESISAVLPDVADRQLVGAFGRGVERTERLRVFEHPGLATVATRSGEALVLQNDIGETEAHVVVIKVVGRAVAVTYTDVHLSRLLFFQRMLSGWGFRREDMRCVVMATHARVCTTLPWATSVRAPTPISSRS